MSERTDAQHRDRRGRVDATFAEFRDEVYLAMGEDDRERLPDDTSGYVAAIVTHALNRLEAFGESLAQTVAGVYEHSPHGERFILNPLATGSVIDETLFLDEDGQLVSMRNADIDWVGPEGEPKELRLRGYQSYAILTGPRAGQRFIGSDRALPVPPRYVPGVVGSAMPSPAAATAPTPAARQTLADAAGGRVFLCHAHEDKEEVRRLYRQLTSWGFRPWLDEEDLLPGEDWNVVIRHAMRDAQVVLVCLSSRSNRRGYVQKEIVRAIDVADEQPEGTIFLIPVLLETGPVPDRLSRWHAVDLSRSGALDKLRLAIATAVRKVDEAA
jgi:hypothetical protein